MYYSAGSQKEDIYPEEEKNSDGDRDGIKTKQRKGKVQVVKYKLKYMIALLLAGSIGMWFMPLIKINSVDISIMDILKVGIGNYGISGTAGEIYPYIEEYFKPKVIVVFIVLVLVLVGAFLTAVISGKKSYVIAIISSIVNNISVISVCLYIKNKMAEVQKALVLLDIGQVMKFSYVTIILWIVMYAVIVLLCILGLWLWRKKEWQEEYVEAMPEKIDSRQNVWERPVAVRQQESTGFEGAVVGETGIFEGKVYSLKERVEVFFEWENGKAVLKKQRNTQNLAGIYYVAKYQEYCIDVFVKSNVFLSSGQPLGAGRTYYLPRGTEIYITNKENQFLLA